MIVSRALAALLAVFWGVVWFGLIDLLTVVLRDPDFTQGYALELGWGLFHLVLVAIPLVVLAVRPQSAAPRAMLAVSAGSVLAAAAWGWSGRVALEGLGLVATVLLVGRPRRVPHRPDPLTLALAAVALPCALWYAATWVNAMDGTPSLDDITNGISHYPLQGAFALSLVGVCGLAAITRSVLTGGCVALCCVAFGLESCIDPELDASLGTVGGIALGVWGVAVLAAVLRAVSAGRPAPDR